MAKNKKNKKQREKCKVDLLSINWRDGLVFCQILHLGFSKGCQYCAGGQRWDDLQESLSDNGNNCTEHSTYSELNMFKLGKTAHFQLRLRKEEQHIKLKFQPSNCYEVCMLLAYLEKDQSSLSVEGKSVKHD